jgi:RNA polymerase sigma factor (sigma-70 family)
MIEIHSGLKRMADKDDIDLVNGLKANDPVYQELLLNRFAGRLLSIVKKRGLCQEDGVEVVNDTFYKIVRTINTFDSSRHRKFSAWVIQIAINTAKDKYKQIKDPLISQSIDERAEKGLQASEALWQEQYSKDSKIGQLSKKILCQALENLSEQDQDILRYRACDMQYKEIAALVNKTPNAAKVAHLRAKKKLKQKYIDILETLQDESIVMAVKNFLCIEAVNEKTAN